MQSRRRSVAEAATNIAVGYAVSVVAQVLIFPLFGIHASIGENVLIGAAFTVASLIRSYTLRRMFNRFGRQAA